MKIGFRILSLVLAVLLLSCSLTSCAFDWLKNALWEIVYTGEVDGEGGAEPLETNREDGALPSDSEEDPEKSQPSHLTYRLSQTDLDAFYALLERCEEACMRAGGTAEELDDLLTQMEGKFYYISSQSQLAYIYYCCNTGSKKASEDYLFASGASSESYDAYMQMCKRIDLSSAPLKEHFFSDWSQADLEEMRGFSQEITELNKDNDRILVEYRELSEEAFIIGASDYYVELVKNNNRIAQLNGYGNYWEYAYSQVYGRDYGKHEIEQMRYYVKEDVVDLCAEALQAFQREYRALSEQKKSLVRDILEEKDYNELEKPYVENYIATFGEEISPSMMGIFEAENSFFASEKNAYQGAFTTFLRDSYRPVCYFGPGYQRADVVVHELGHYYSYLKNGSRSIQMDLAEVQSQGNEWLFWAYMDSALSADVMDAIYYYQLYNALCTVIIGCVIDEFEQRCYQNGISYGDGADDIMGAVLYEYGGEEYVENLLGTDLNLYWRYVTVESSVYYVSYAVSMLGAVQIYHVAQDQSYEKAMEVYLGLIQPASNVFLASLTAVGLKTPMDPKLYDALAGMV